MSVVYVISSTAATHYTDALSENQVEIEAFPALRGNEHGKILSVIVKAKQNLKWQVELYDYGGNIILSHAFSESDATVEEKDGITWYNYNYTPIESWGVPVVVPDEAVNVGLRNKSSQSKTADDDGAAIVKFMLCK